MAETGFLFLLFFVLAALGPLVLYWWIARETANPRVVDRETAEREARELGGTRGSQGQRRGRSDGAGRSDRADGRDRDDEL